MKDWKMPLRRFFRFSWAFVFVTPMDEPQMSPLMPTLDQALNWSSSQWVEYVGRLNSKQAQCVFKKGWSECYPQLKTSDTLKSGSDQTIKIRTLIQKFKKMGFQKANLQAQWILSTENGCEDSLQWYALAWALESFLPRTHLPETISQLFLKVKNCQSGEISAEAGIRGALFLALQTQISQALEVVQSITPANINQRDRILFLRKLWKDPVITDEYLSQLKPVPWGMYGHLLFSSAQAFLDPWRSKPLFLRFQPDQKVLEPLLPLIAWLMHHERWNELSDLARRLDYEKLKKDHPAYQVTVALTFAKAGLDLPAFRIIHQVLAYHPDYSQYDQLLPLLFPVRYWSLIIKSGREHGLDPILIKSLIRQESGFDHRARSVQNARGLMQLIPSTAIKLGVSSLSVLFDPEVNIEVGSRYFSQLLREFQNVELALAAYNAGPERVKTWIQRYPTQNVELFVELIPYRETREYVRLIRRNQFVYEHVMKLKAWSDEVQQQEVQGSHVEKHSSGETEKKRDRNKLQRHQ